MNKLLFNFVIVASACLISNHIEASVFKDVTINLFNTTDEITSPFINKTVHITEDNQLETHVKSVKEFTVLKILINRQNIPELKENSIANLENLEDITILNCNIEVIQPGAFKNLPKLRRLILGSNQLKNIKYGIISSIGVKSLDEVHLNFNQISIIDDNVFENIDINSLHLGYNKLTQWKSSWFNKCHLKNIRLTGTEIEEIPANAFGLEEGDKISMDFVYLPGNKIKKIHKDAFKGVEDIKMLLIGENELENLDADVLKNVHHLGYYKGNLKQLDLNIIKDTKIVSLDLRNNQLNCVDTAIFNKPQFSKLDLEGNPVTCECMKTWADWITAHKLPEDSRVTFGFENEERCNITI